MSKHEYFIYDPHKIDEKKIQAEAAVHLHAGTDVKIHFHRHAESCNPKCYVPTLAEVPE